MLVSSFKNSLIKTFKKTCVYIENLLPPNLVFWTTKTGNKMKTKTGKYLVFRK